MTHDGNGTDKRRQRLSGPRPGSGRLTALVCATESYGKTRRPAARPRAFASSESAEPHNHHLRTWGAHERVTVKRVTAEEGKR